ncbi:hypothetical protein SN13T_2279 [Lactiplantibacillus plantarum]|nr:hypothetical protein SN13T_2279 [Lactiplantibacillus plantarum]
MLVESAPPVEPAALVVPVEPVTAEPAAELGAPALSALVIRLGAAVLPVLGVAAADGARAELAALLSAADVPSLLSLVLVLLAGLLVVLSGARLVGASALVPVLPLVPELVAADAIEPAGTPLLVGVPTLLDVGAVELVAIEVTGLAAG